MASLLVVAVGAVALGIGEDDAPGDRRASPGHLLDANNSPSLARSPRDAAVVALVHRVDRPRFSAQLLRSGDGGRTWRPTALPLPPGLDRPFAPDVAFAPDGTLYVSYVNLVGEGNVPDNLWVARSTDGGRTLSEPVRVAGSLAFQGRIAVGGDRTVYVTWLQAASVGLFRLSGAPNPIVAARSDDGGRTFAPPVQVSDPSRERVAAATPVVDGNGRLLVLYEDFHRNRRDFEFLEGPPAEEPFSLVLTVSEDGGRRFAPGIDLETGVVALRRFMVFLPEFPSVAVGPGGAVAIAWADGRNGDEDVFVRRSADGGRTWTGPVKVNDTPRGDGSSQYLPRVAIAPSGRVDVLFLDRRADADDVLAEAYLGTADGPAAPFRNRRVSSSSFDSGSGPFIDAAFPVDFGSRLGLLSDDDGVLAAWTDSRLARLDSGRQDIFTSRVDLGGPRRWSSALAVVVVVVVLASLGGAVLARRSARRA